MNQKEEEKLVMQYFRESYEDFPKGKLVVSESPDFILKIKHKKSIGIELTRLDIIANSLKEKIEATLENKSEKLLIYQKKSFTKIWLIIYTEFIDEPKSYNIQNKLNTWNFSSEFDQVFLFDLFERKIFGLNL